jgi:hypothetical protein
MARADERPNKFAYESVRAMRLELHELRHELRAVQDKLRAEAERADRCEKSARDAWSFAKLALRTGQPE